MNEQELKHIAQELQRMNKNFEKLIEQLKKPLQLLQENKCVNCEQEICLCIGSSGEQKVKSEK